MFLSGFVRPSVWSAVFRANGKGIPGNLEGEGRLLGGNNNCFTHICLSVTLLLKIFWAIIFKKVRPVLLDRCPVCLSDLSVTLVYCGQMVGWIKMKLASEVGLGPSILC